MSSSKKLLTINSNNQFKFKEKGSLFIGHCFYAEKLDEAEKFLAITKKNNYNANHNCFACKIYPGEIKYSDDGEPNGTGGLRILNAIEHFNLINVITVVTRYFGGVKLGIGPLGKAYYNAALNVLSAAGKTEKEIYSKIYISFEFEMMSHVHHYLNHFEAKEIISDYQDMPTISCLVRPGIIDNLRSKLGDVSSGRIDIKDTGIIILM